MKILSATTSFFTGLLIVVLYIIFNQVPLGFGVLFNILPDGDVYISGQAAEGIIAYFVFALIGLGLFYFARKNPEKKIRNLALYIVSALLIIGFQVAKTLYGAKAWHYEWNHYWDEGLKNLMLDMLPFTFLALGFLVVAGSRTATIALTAIFSYICLYHLLLSSGFLRVFGRAFSAVSGGDLAFAIIITASSLAFAVVNFMAARRIGIQPKEESSVEHKN